MALARANGHPPDLVAALNTQGLLAREQDSYAHAKADYHAALSLARASADGAGEATALLGLAYTALFTGDAARASVLAEESLAVARELGDSHVLARVLSLLGWAASNVGSYGKAETLATEALGLFRTLGDTGQQAEMLFLLGTVAMYSSAYERAAGFFTQSLGRRRDRGDEHGTATDLAALGGAVLNLHDLPRARALTEESLTVARRFGDRWSSALSLTMLGHVDLADGHDARAQALFAEAEALFEAIGNLMYVPWCLEGLAGVAAAHGLCERAAELDGASQALRAQIGLRVPPIHPAGYARTMTAIRGGLTQEAFDAARAAGGRRRSRSSRPPWPTCEPFALGDVAPPAGQAEAAAGRARTLRLLEVYPGAGARVRERRTIDDAEAVARSLGGDLDAYAVLVARYTLRAHRAAFLLGAGEEADDVVQEAFVKAFRHLSRFRVGDPFAPWLLRIVANETKNLARSRRRTAALAIRLCAAESSGTAGGGPADMVLAAERRAGLLAAVNALPDKERQVLVCRYFLDLSEVGTAQVLGWPLGTVKSRTFRALKRLRGLLLTERQKRVSSG